jgi:hypothetical protein
VGNTRIRIDFSPLVFPERKARKITENIGLDRYRFTWCPFAKIAGRNSYPHPSISVISRPIYRLTLINGVVIVNPTR